MEIEIKVEKGVIIERQRLPRNEVRSRWEESETAMA
ncbi:uncharacterized protein G2W53_007480 [Senna tora]|uniref:Uncharacterized protein n=1 Tax=Senna tora TaxID=362788 RepID=A0A834X6C5_9FABA|nr:uncharacterized protein G2W53_007480 [Senna tora]